MSNSYILLWLEAPLQSWGHDSKFGRRDSLDFPTKSGILGLICCARGAGGEESEWLQSFANTSMNVVAYSRADKSGEALDRLPLLRDFHMVGSGYDAKDPWQSLLIPKTQDGKKSVGGGSKMTYRYYIQDMAFAVVLEVPDTLKDNIISSLKMPVWSLYLGRKCCVPTAFIFQGEFPDKETAHDKAEKLSVEKNRIFTFKVIDGMHDGEVLVLNDVPLSFGPQKQYRDRRVTVQKWR